MKEKKIFILDHPIVVFALRNLLRSHPEWEVETSINDDLEPIRQEITEVLKPDLIILNLFSRQRNAIWLLNELAKLKPRIYVLLFTENENEWALRAVRLGVFGFVLRKSKPEEILNAVEKAINMEWQLEEFVGKEEKVTPLSCLSERETEIFFYISEGKSSRRISEILGLEIKTIQAHITNIRAKLKMKKDETMLFRATNYLK